MTSARAVAACTSAGAAAAAWMMRDLGAPFVLPRTPLWALCAAMSLTAGVAVLRPASAVVHGALGALRLSVPLLLTLAWTAEGKELWGALAVWVAVHDGWRGAASRAPLAPAALAIVGVIAWSSTRDDVAPGRAVLVGLVAGVAARWASERRAQPFER